MAHSRVSCLLLGAFALPWVGCGGKVLPLGGGTNDAGEGPSGAGGSGGGGAAGAGGAGGGGGLAGDTSSGATSGNAGSPSGGSGGAGRGALSFLDASPVMELNTESVEDNPTLTRDGLQIFFTSDRDDNADVWFATRSLVTEPFGLAEKLDVANTDDEESSPAISLDGLTLWVGQNDQPGGLGNYDIWELVRSSPTGGWSAPRNVVELNSPEDDIPRPPAVADTIMPLGSRRSMEGYRTYLATRSTPADAFGEPVLIEELSVPGQSTVDGFLTEDGLMLFYGSAAAEDEGDLFYATRPSRDDPFGHPTPITDLNTSADERDPWLSPDGTALYFATDREGTRDIYRATVSRE